MTVYVEAASRRKRKLTTAVIVAIVLLGIVQAGYVDFYRDADFEHKITRVKPVQADICYNLGCFGLDDVVTSAKWGDLPERTFGDTSTKITFYTDRGCTSKHKSWPVKTESDGKLHFPKDFKADGINDAISSFMVVKEGNIDNEEYVFSESAKPKTCSHISIFLLDTNPALMKTLQQQSCILASVLFIAVVQAGWVELYKDANHKHKLSRIEDIEYDQCYSFACDALDNTITSAKWGGLSEKMANGDDAMISFYIDRDCLEHNIWWRIKTQSDDDLYFPSDFRLDGINDEISAFMVWHTKKTRLGGGWDICTSESGELDVGGNATANSTTANSTTANSTFGSGSGALDNNTITALA